MRYSRLARSNHFLVGLKRPMNHTSPTSETSQELSVDVRKVDQASASSEGSSLTYEPDRNQTLYRLRPIGMQAEGRQPICGSESIHKKAHQVVLAELSNLNLRLRRLGRRGRGGKNPVPGGAPLSLI